MKTIPSLFDHLDNLLEKITGEKDLRPQDEVEKKYMLTQGFIAIIFLIAFGIVAKTIDAKMVLEFSQVFIFIMLTGMFIFYRARKIDNLILVFKISMIVVSSIYVLRMGGLFTSGGMFLLAAQAVTSSIILKKFWRILVVVSVFIVSMSLLLAFQPYFPTENALTFSQNKVIFGMSLFGVTGYIFFFSLFAVNLFTRMEQRETQRQKEMNDAKTRLYTNITHEFRTPLTVILGMADSVKNNGQENIAAKMDSIIKNGKNLMQLVDQMLDLSKLESGRMSVNKINANIIPFLKYVFQLQQFYAEEKHISMFFSAGSQSYELEFDPEKTAAVASNLLNNAIKFTPEGGQISMNVFAEEDLLCMEIKDNGIGIPPEKLDKIFDRFYQADDQNTRKEGGAGIGLAITREFVQLMQGSIEVKSSAGVGTVFSVKLPYISSANKPDLKEVENHPIYQERYSDTDNFSPNHLNSRQRLLIIEDNPDVVGYLKACYQEHYSIQVAKDGKEGFNMAVDEIPDIIISDVMMPEMDGFELCQKLKDDYRTSHIPIILLTAKADIPSRIEGLETGADAYVVKPFNQQELLVRMRKLLELRKKLFQRYSNGNGMQPSSDPVLQKEDEFFRKLKETIQNNLQNEDYNVPELCKDMAMSKSQLYRKFKALTGKSVARYIRTLRMQKARELLQTTSLNITEVGYEVGMKSLSTFSQIFKEEFGESPREFLNHQAEKAI
ncbi:MAG: ATP-binding protein [Bacteroides sp.]|jgi:signal transduction histidine kinase/DNA-binding response OmpR family regulator|nr:ATP-binding protein [Bacteroides sp.]